VLWLVEKICDQYDTHPTIKPIGKGYGVVMSASGQDKLVVRGVSVTEDDPRSLIVHFNRPISDDDLKRFHEFVRAFKGIPEWILVGGRQIFCTLMVQHVCIHQRTLKTNCYECHEYWLSEQRKGKH
jgi:hypothetical protein